MGLIPGANSSAFQLGGKVEGKSKCNNDGRVAEDEVGYRDGDGVQVATGVSAESATEEGQKEGTCKVGHCQVLERRY